MQCQDFNNIGGWPSDWERVPNSTLGNWTYVNSDALEATIAKKTTTRPTGETPFTKCTKCSIEGSIKATLPFGGSVKKISLLGWYDFATRKDRVEVILNYEKGNIKLKHITANGTNKANISYPLLQLDTPYLVRVNFDGNMFHVSVDGTPLPELDLAPVEGTVPYGYPGFRVKGGPNDFSGTLDYIDVGYGSIFTCTDNCSAGCTEVIPKSKDTGDQFSTNQSSNSMLSVGAITVDEGTGGINYARVRIEISPANSSPLTFDYSTSAGTATSNVDYIAESGTASLEKGQSAKVITIPIVADTNIESDETFTITLSNPSRGGSISTSQATVTIEDDDTAEDDDGPDNEFEIACPTEFSVLKDDVRTMSCGITPYDFLNLSTDIAWNCNNSSSVQCTFTPQGSTQLNVQVDPGASTPVGNISNFTIAGVIDSISRTDALTLRVLNFQPACPDPITVLKGQYTDSTCAVAPSSNWTIPQSR